MSVQEKNQMSCSTSSVRYTHNTSGTVNMLEGHCLTVITQDKEAGSREVRVEFDEDDVGC